MKYPVPIWLALVGTLFAGLATGCGGHNPALNIGGVSNRSSEALIRFVWPKRTRLIPIAANSIKLTLASAGHTYTKLITRPEAAASDTTLVTFESIFPGDYTVTSQAYPSADGSGAVQATGATTFTVLQNQQAPFTVTMLSTVTRMTLTGPSSLSVGRTSIFIAKAFNAADVEVLVDPSTVQWSAPSDTRVSSPTGNQITLKPLLSLSGNLSATYTEPGGTPPVASVSFDAIDNFYELGTPLDGGGFDASTERSVADITGDSTLDTLLIPTDNLTQNAIIGQANPRQSPSWGTNLFTLAGTGKVLSTVVDKDGKVFAAVQSASGVALYTAVRGAALQSRFALPATTLDIAVDGSSNVYALSSLGASVIVQKFANSGTASSVGITTDASTKRVAADENGNVYVDGLNVRRLSPGGVESTPLGTLTETVLDLSALDGNVYVMLTPGPLSLAHVTVVTGEGDLLADVNTDAFFRDEDTTSRFSIDKVTGDFYLARNFLDISNYQTFQAVTLFAR